MYLKLVQVYSISILTFYVSNTISEKTKARIEKAKTASTRKKEIKDEPEAKKRREDMTDDEKREFDSWLDEVRTKRQELIEKRAARHFRKQQLTKR